jgi:hypothetical protein
VPAPSDVARGAAGEEDAPAEPAATPAEDDGVLPVVASPTERRPAEVEPTIAELEDVMRPTPWLPEWRIRVGGGISLGTSGAEILSGRVTQEVEFQPTPLEFLQFGLAAAQTIGAQQHYQFGARLGVYALWFEDSVFRLHGAIDIQLGLVTGIGGPELDFAGDVDIRFLFGRVIELYVRGGFFVHAGASIVNITGGMAVAF